MNGIEVEAILHSHAFARMCPDPEVKRQLAEVRYAEHQQQKAVNWLLPGSASALETTRPRECLDLLRTTSVGRLVVTRNAVPARRRCR